MAIAFLSPARTVLLIGDEALYIYSVNGKVARLIDTVPWQSDTFEDVVTGLLKKECEGKPVLILNDMTDQYFKGGQRLPNVGFLDKSNVMKRKLQVAFPNYPIRGALKTKRKKGADKAASAAAGEGGNIRTKGDVYLFAGVPSSEPLNRTFEAVKRSLAPVAGFVLLPVESSDMVKTLAEKLAGKERKPNEWAVFIGQHQNGALRQVIIRDGQLAMTRITAVTDKDSDHNAWATEVYQEFKATLSYLSRYGYSQDDGTDLMVVASPEAGDALERMIEIPCNYTSFTVNEAARVLGMTVGMQEEPRYADPLHAAWAGRKTSFILPMDATDLKRIHQPRQYAAAAMVLLMLGIGYLGWQGASEAEEMFSTRSELSEQKSVLAQAEAEYQEELARMEALGFDVKLIQAATRTFAKLDENRMAALPLLAKIGDALGNELRIDKISVEDKSTGFAPPTEAPVDAAYVDPSQSQESDQSLVATMVLSFPPTIEPEEGVREISNLERRLKTILPEYTVTIIKQVGDPVYTEEAAGEVGQSADEARQTLDLTAQIEIKGPLRLAKKTETVAP